MSVSDLSQKPADPHERVGWLRHRDEARLGAEIAEIARLSWLTCTSCGRPAMPCGHGMSVCCHHRVRVQGWS